MYSYNLLYAFHSLLNFQIFKQILIKRLKNIFDIFNIVENGFTKSKKCKTKKKKKTRNRIQQKLFCFECWKLIAKCNGWSKQTVEKPIVSPLDRADNYLNDRSRDSLGYKNLYPRTKYKLLLTAK